MTTEGSSSVSTPGKPETIKSVVESGEEHTTEDHTEKAQSNSLLSPGKVGSFFKSFVTRSPSKTLKSPKTDKESSGKEDNTKMSKQKKMSKTKKGAKNKPKKSDEKTESAELPTSEGTSKSDTAMVQTTLSNTTEGIEVISSPEQPQVKVQRKKTKKQSRRSEKQNTAEEKKQTRISDLFQLRKSTRVCKSDQKKNELARITEAILSKKDEGLEVRNIEGKGRGIFAKRPFSKNDFVCEYAGDLIGLEEAKKREEIYSTDVDIGCYMYYIQYNNKKYCIDATAENGRFGRLLNHSRTGGNCKTTVHAIKDKPRLILVAIQDIEKGEELTYDYGDRSKESIESHPWLKH